MRIAQVIGTVTLNQPHPSLAAARLKIVVPLSGNNLTGESHEPSEDLVAIDELGAGVGSRVALSDGAEAAQPFLPDIKPIDAYCAAILDNVELEGSGFGVRGSGRKSEGVT